jgi:hypothetical protein
VGFRQAGFLLPAKENKMYHGFTESPDVILARMKRILADYQPLADTRAAGSDETMLAADHKAEQIPQTLTTE